MYQLSHLLIEQRNILSALKHDENCTEEVKGMIDDAEEHEISDKEAQNAKALQAIKDNLIGFNDNLENKIFLHEGALIELDSESYRPICRVYFFLLNNLLIIGKVKHDK